MTLAEQILVLFVLFVVGVVIGLTFGYRPHIRPVQDGTGRWWMLYEHIDRILGPFPTRSALEDFGRREEEREGREAQSTAHPPGGNP